MPIRFCLVAALLAFTPHSARAEAALAAISANFAETAEAILPLFHEATGHDLTLTTGSTGKLHAQIAAGAPFDILLSADAADPGGADRRGPRRGGQRLHLRHRAAHPVECGSRPHRRGRTRGARRSRLRFVAIANPDLAPYGVAGARDIAKPWGCGRRFNQRSSWARISGKPIRWSPPARRSWALSRSRRCSARAPRPRAAAGTSRRTITRRSGRMRCCSPRGRQRGGARLSRFPAKRRGGRVIARFGYGTGD